MQMEMANFLLTKENDPAADSPTKKEQQKAWAVNLNGFDVEEAKILHLRGKPQNAPEGCQNKLKVLYSQKMAPGSSRKNSRNIPSKPERVLDAPEMFNDYLPAVLSVPHEEQPRAEVPPGKECPGSAQRRPEPGCSCWSREAFLPRSANEVWNRTPHS
ncbi:cell division cycle protein 20 homolog [Ammospiza nelsoni]|uniref:cell division cycle protein 20 homolog n=1 Tax=Ammospiza nelsoni TaxID=2857394 RepID=UPI00286AEFB4|nr:cell division cycle protein 20 homolog [Ammospiza nelsoni]